MLASLLQASQAAMLLLASLMLLVASQPSQAALYSLRDTRPGLSSDAAALDWWEGGPAFALASAGAVRINFRGLYVYPAKSVLRDLDGWHSASCNASAWALCAADVGQVLPWTGPRQPERREAVTADGWKDLGCLNSRGKLLVSLGVYDISACDVFDEGLDLVYAGNTIYHRHSTLELWEYWLLVVLSIVLVRFLSYNIQALWDPAPDTRPQLPALVCALLVVLVVLVDGDSHFVTSADQVFFWATIVYIAIYLAMHAKATATIPVYNVLVATLQLVASRFYAAAETPYNLVLIGILAARGWNKLMAKTDHSMSLLLDSLYLSLCIELAFDGTRELLIGVLGVAYLGGVLLAGREA